MAAPILAKALSHSILPSRGAPPLGRQLPDLEPHIGKDGRRGLVRSQNAHLQNIAGAMTPMFRPDWPARSACGILFGRFTSLAPGTTRGGVQSLGLPESSGRIRALKG